MISKKRATKIAEYLDNSEEGIDEWLNNLIETAKEVVDNEFGIKPHEEMPIHNLIVDLIILKAKEFRIQKR